MKYFSGCLFFVFMHFTAFSQYTSNYFNQNTRQDYASSNSIITKVSKSNANQINPHTSQTSMQVMSPQKLESNAIYGIVATLGIGKLRYTINNEDVITFNQSLTKCGGLSIEFPLEVMDGKVSIYNELTFSQFEAKASDVVIDTNQFGYPDKFDSKYNFSPNILSLTHIFRYVLTPNEFKYYVGVGAYNNIIVGATNKKETRVTTALGEHYIYDKAVQKPATHGLMLIASTGFSYRNIGFELRYDPGRNYTNVLENYVFQQLFTAHFHVRFNPK